MSLRVKNKEAKRERIHAAALMSGMARHVFDVEWQAPSAAPAGALS